MEKPKQDDAIAGEERLPATKWLPPKWTSAPTDDLGLGSQWDSTRRSTQSLKPVERSSRKSPKKLRLPHPTERKRTTFLLNDDDNEPSLRRPGLSGSTITSSLCPSDADNAEATDTDFLLADKPPPPPLANDAEPWWPPLDDKDGVNYARRRRPPSGQI
ncbi:hypothetical protein OsJ_29294 [Oryza sativa Japonica Group]|uniref:Uncharacterized protein n=1 Tax=Oryza sativa subsp. japonica TaxID=39947 RepID=A3BYN0_ORYSJ|nr:hypothetical protein OsJ_29294 [Oryza sativa Japonica Group]